MTERCERFLYIFVLLLAFPIAGAVSAARSEPIEPSDAIASDIAATRRPTSSGGAFNHFNDGINKNRNTNACILKDRDRFPEIILVPDGIPPMIRCQLVKSIRYKGHLVGVYFQYQVNKFLFCTVTFNIKLCGDDLPDLSHIIVPDMSFIGSWMHGNAICSKTLSIHGGFCNIGIIAAP